jgi:hypothetical protein
MRARAIERQAKHAATLRTLATSITPSSPAVLDWWSRGCPPPPPNARKRQLLYEVCADHGLSTAVETGTFLGDTTAFLSDRCSQVFTIELDPGLAERARQRFRDLSHVTVLEGDSTDLLQSVLAQLDEPALFWLDGHFSGCHEGVQTARGSSDTPLVHELQALVRWKHFTSSAIVIDDARLLGVGDYPSLDDVRAVVGACGDQSVSIACDSVVIQPYLVRRGDDA